MVYDPTTNQDIHQMDYNDLVRFQAMNTGALGAMAAPNPMVIDEFFREFSRLVNRQTIKDFFLRVAGRDPQTERMRRELEKRLGVELPLGPKALRALMGEVKTYKWLEAERAGHDIWLTRNPVDPDGTALQEWFRQHFGAWYLANVRQQPAHS